MMREGKALFIQSLHCMAPFYSALTMLMRPWSSIWSACAVVLMDVTSDVDVWRVAVLVRTSLLSASDYRR